MAQFDFLVGEMGVGKIGVGKMGLIPPNRPITLSPTVGRAPSEKIEGAPI